MRSPAGVTLVKARPRRVKMRNPSSPSQRLQLFADRGLGRRKLVRRCGEVQIVLYDGGKTA